MKHPRRKKLRSLLFVLALVMSVFVVTPAPTVQATKKINKTQLKKKTLKQFSKLDKYLQDTCQYRYNVYNYGEDELLSKSTSSQYTIIRSYCLRCVFPEGKGIREYDRISVKYQGKLNKSKTKITYKVYYVTGRTKKCKKKISVSKLKKRCLEKYDEANKLWQYNTNKDDDDKE